MKVVPVSAASAVAAVVLFAGCSGGSRLQCRNVRDAAGGPRHPWIHAPIGHRQPLRRGVALSSRFFSPQLAPDHHRKRIEKEFFISDTGSNVFVFKNSTYAKVGDITSGITASDGVWVDKKGNVYVANVISNVVEYKKGAGSPICTYSASLTDPINGTTDSAGNVYIADFEGGAVREYAQCSNTVKATFTVSIPRASPLTARATCSSPSEATSKSSSTGPGRCSAPRWARRPASCSTTRAT